MLENYVKLSNGVISQHHRQPFKYGFDYSANYNKLGEAGRNMAYLRLGYLLAAVPGIKSILDIGYGNGDFITAASKAFPQCYASDVSNVYPLPDNVKFVPQEEIGQHNYDVITLFDVLEHFTNIYDVFKPAASYIYVSLPNCEYKSDEWFKNWKHRKPDEHLWFFNKKSLKAFMIQGDYVEVVSGYPEDVLRQDRDNSPNILSGIFKKINVLN